MPTKNSTEAAVSGRSLTSCSPSAKFHCWCGVEDPYFADETDGLDDTCGGMGTLTCRCGGDICVCHNHGETECPGCDDCEEDDDDDIYSYEDYEENARAVVPGGDVMSEE